MPAEKKMKSEVKNETINITLNNYDASLDVKFEGASDSEDPLKADKGKQTVNIISQIMIKLNCPLG